MKTAVYPGTFDPVTNGHIDIIERALKLFDRLYVVVGDNPQKAPTFTAKERVAMLKEALKKHNNKIDVEHFEGLLLNYVKKKKSNVVIRGLRAISDFDFESGWIRFSSLRRLYISVAFFQSTRPRLGSASIRTSCIWLTI